MSKTGGRSARSPKRKAPAAQHALRSVELAREGITPRTFQGIVARSPLGMAEWGHALDLSERTLQRFRTSGTRLGRAYADRVVQLANLMEHGLAVFGEPERFRRWFERPNIALGGVRPKDLIDTSFGTGLVDDELGRIEHGLLA
ncbi:MAG: DUF2384 domain-containing protein [Bacteroidetes bacterium]|nr:DUF2384 domain-containing protein [Bacteroidota bacterium]